MAQGFSDSEPMPAPVVACTGYAGTGDGLRMLNASGTKLAPSKGYFCFGGFSVYTLTK
jgi:hypothetical protein